ncbi:lytic transglycosylase, partial [Erwinia billingiae]|nr:lytic transglycosylase [Erwinia billingiae]
GIAAKTDTGNNEEPVMQVIKKPVR